MDLILINGNIITMNDAYPKAEAMAINGGEFVKVGSNEEVLNFRTEDTKILDLRNKTVVPGFNDSHMHLLEFGYSLTKVDLNGSKSIDEVIERAKSFLKNSDMSEKDWVKGRGWNQDIFKEKRFLNRYDLDKISKETPIYMTRVCGHVIAVNSKALEIMGVSKNTPQIEGGHFDVDEKGEPTGIFRENARDYIFNCVNPPKREDIKLMIMEAADAYAAQGITSVQTEDLDALPGIHYEEILNAYKELAEAGKLKIRIYEQCIFRDINTYKDFLSKGYKTGYGDDYFKIGPLKLVRDGALGGRTALLREPYSDDPASIGISCFTQEELDEWVLTAQAANMTVAVHCIGDAAMYSALDSIEKAKKSVYKEDMRHSIIHCQITEKEIINRFRELGVIAHVQPIFLDYDLHIVEDRVGKERAKYTYNFKRMLDEGVHVAGGSDYPYCEFYQVFLNLHAAINRQDVNGFPKGGWLPDQKLSVSEAIGIFTKGSAYASYDEERKGIIGEGKLADFFVMSDDIYMIKPSEIKNMQVEMTFMGGNLVYERADIR